MNFRGKKLSPFLISVTAIIALTAMICVLVPICAASSITFETSYYFVCYAIKDNSVSAGSISGAVSNYGGAGYILERGNEFYITVSCYYEEKDAQTVCESLKKRDLECSVLAVETGEYSLRTSANAELYTGNLNTLNSLSVIAFGCANSLDLGDCDQTRAKTVISDIESGLKGLLNANRDNCFSSEIRRLIAICGDISEGYVYSKDLRKLQIAIADTVINIKLY